MKLKMKIGRILNKLTPFDWLAILVILAALVFAAPFIFKQERWLTVEVKMAPEQWWWEANPPPYWLADTVKVGDKAYDALGRKIAETVDVRTLEWGATRKEAYLTVNLKANYDRRKQKFTFKQRPLEVGRPIELELGGAQILGLITYVEGLPDERQKVTKKVAAKILGVQPWIAVAIPAGGGMKDSRGRVLARVLDKRVELAREFTAVGTVATNPLKRDVTLTLELETVEQGGIFYFREGQAVKVGQLLWIQLPGVDISAASIMEILE